MHYSFPAGLTLAEVRDVVRRHNARLGSQCFIEVDHGDHVIFNYVVTFPGVFPDMTEDCALNREYAILRECRGITFSPITGRVIARKFHKFFNINERDETQIGRIDWGREHVVLDKLDGSMITPFRPDGSDIRWGTKMGLTDVARPVEQFVGRNDHFQQFAEYMVACGTTPIFEWCSRQQKIVVDYPEDKLVLTAARDMESGEYLPMKTLYQVTDRYGIDVAGRFSDDVGCIHAFLAHTHDLKGAEGYVVRFSDGHMVKAKAEEYRLIHATKDGLQFEKDVITLILSDTLDDAKAHMDADDRKAVDAYAEAFFAGLAATATEVQAEVEAVRSQFGTDRKRFSLEYAEAVRDPFRRRLSHAAFQGMNLVEAMTRIIAKYTGSGTRVDMVRDLFGGIHWKDYRTFSGAE